MAKRIKLANNLCIHNKHLTINSVYYEVVTYTQTYKKQLFIINELITLNVCHCLALKHLKNKEKNIKPIKEKINIIKNVNHSNNNPTFFQ